MYSDRETVPTMDPIDGTLSLHSVKSVPGARNVRNEGLRQLILADFPCRCLPCRKKGPPEDKCKFTELRNERGVWVNTSGEGTRASHLLDTDEAEQKLLLRLQRFGLEKARVQDIREYLKAGKQSTSGTRRELAQRALDMDEVVPDSSNRPLAITAVGEEPEEDVNGAEASSTSD